MYWVPVLFACLVEGQCFFIYDQPKATEQQCLKEVEAMLKEAKTELNATSKGTCLKISRGLAI